MDNDDDILADIRSGWSKQISNVELPEFTGEPGVNVNLRSDAPMSDFFNLFIDDDDFALMATETNRYYSQMGDFQKNEDFSFSENNLNIK